MSASLPTVAGRLAAGMGRVVLSLLSALVPRRPTQWVFGAWFGWRYSDNARYVFEHVRVHLPHIRAVWMTRDAVIAERLRAEGHEAALIGTWRGYWTCARAGLAVVSSGCDDVARPALTRAPVIQLWHGTPLKRIKWDDTVNEARPVGKVRTALRAVRRAVLPSKEERYAMLVAPSEIVQARLASAFRVTPDRVAITGWPRNDALLRRPATSLPFIERARQARPGARLVCFAPTFRRQSGAAALFATLDRERLEEILARHNAVLVIKLHFVERDAIPPVERFAAGGRVLWPSDDEVSDINLLLPHVDLLVTDYSSVYFDYLLLDRPIVFTPFDLERYLAAERGMYEDYHAATPGPKCATWDAALAQIDAVLAGEDEWGDVRRAATRRYNAFVDASSSERVARLALQVAGAQ